ncbi:hypothetical protein VAB55_003135 [Salmonella enterica]|nr:hypothetical protein [Salmonella enterica]
MEPTKKRSVAECGLATITLLLLSTGPALAEPYTQSPKTVFGTKIETPLSTKVTSIIAPTEVVWSPASAATSNHKTLLGDLHIMTSGDGIKAAAYVIEPCGGAPDYDLKINGADTPLHLSLEGPSYSPHDGFLTAATDARSIGLLKIYADVAPMAGEYTTCVAVTSMADEPDKATP